MGVVVRLFFLMILSSILLTGIMGWFAMLRSKLPGWHGKSCYDKGEKNNNNNIIEGEYKVLDEEDR